MRGRRPRVGCRFRGGLANQMFTVATTLAYGWRHNLDITISARQLTSAANTQFAGRNSVMPLFREIPRSWKRTAINASTRRDRFELHEFAPIGPPQDENDIVLDGLFGHCGYFDDARNQLLQVFRPQHRTAAALDARFASLFDGETVSVSIRRGDYLRQRTLRRYDLELDYYQRALDLLPPAANVLVFSDDIDWCKDNLYFDRPTDYVVGGSALADMYLISRCTHHVICNSTFAWWGAWLDDKSEGLTVRPAQWFTSQFIDKLGRDPIAHDPDGWLSI